MSRNINNYALDDLMPYGGGSQSDNKNRKVDISLTDVQSRRKHPTPKDKSSLHNQSSNDIFLKRRQSHQTNQADAADLSFKSVKSVTEKGTFRKNTNIINEQPRRSIPPPHAYNGDSP